MADMERSGGLRTIFALFLGLMLTAFVGVGVYTFHPPPDQFNSQIRDLARQEETIRNSKPANELTTADRAQIQAITRQQNDLRDAAAASRVPWGRSTSVILIVFATLAMAVSLVRANQLPVISNGLLLGGVITMLYGVCWILVTDTSIIRFLVMTIALGITLALGYVRFVRPGPMSPVTAGLGVGEAEGVAGIERRVRSLEQRMNEAANALGPKADGSRTP